MEKVSVLRFGMGRFALIVTGARSLRAAGPRWITFGVGLVDLASCAAAHERATARTFGERELAVLRLAEELLDTGHLSSELRHMVQAVAARAIGVAGVQDVEGNLRIQP